MLKSPSSSYSQHHLLLFSTIIQNPEPNTLNNLCQRYGKTIVTRQILDQCKNIVITTLQRPDLTIQELSQDILKAKHVIEFIDIHLKLNGNLEKEFLSIIEMLVLGDEEEDEDNNNNNNNTIKNQIYDWAKSDLAYFLIHGNDNNNDTTERRRTRASLGGLMVTLHWNSALEPMFLSVADEAVASRIHELCKGIYDCSFLKDILFWVRERVLSWLTALSFGDSLVVASGNNNNTAITTATINGDRLYQRLEFFVYETLQSIRQTEIFDLVTTYPDSKPALRDFKACLLRTHSQMTVAQVLAEALNRRLLHSGVSTNAIILVYIKMKRTLSVLDPTNGIFDIVSPAVKQFLRERPETVRCVVTALTNDGSNSELHQELGLSDVNNLQQIDFDDDEDKHASKEFFSVLAANASLSSSSSTTTATAAAVAAAAVNTSEEILLPEETMDDDKNVNSNTTSTDILGELVKIYTSKEVFVHEFKSLLAVRLVNTPNYDLAQEIRSLELLKLKFGDAAMRECDIMIKDVEDSRRANNLVQVAKNVVPTEAVIISRHFWPKLSVVDISEKMILHPWLKSSFRAYSKSFSIVKKPKKLIWLNTVGFVSLDVVDDNTGTIKTYENCSMIHANVLCWLMDEGTITLAKLSLHMGSTFDITRRYVNYWVAEGIAKANMDSNGMETYSCSVTLGKNEQSSSTSANTTNTKDATMEMDDSDHSHDSDGRDDDGMDLIGNEDGGGGGSVDNNNNHTNTHGNDHQEEEEMELDLNPGTPAAEFVLHMLTNLGMLNLESIHRNLTLFGMPEWKQSDLAVLLDNLVVAGVVEMKGDLFGVVENKN
jgi:anaphase-promoting complex subunit 2